MIWLRSMPPILPRMKNPGSAVEALAGECNKATRSQVVLKHRTVLRQRCNTAQPPLGANADRIEYAGADVDAQKKSAARAE
jgi:hypothetical protein